jgi:hypothetical protein
MAKIVARFTDTKATNRCRNRLRATSAITTAQPTTLIVQTEPSSLATPRMAPVNPGLRRAARRLILQPHLSFASLVVCASGAGLVAASPS